MLAAAVAPAAGAAADEVEVLVAPATTLAAVEADVARLGGEVLATSEAVGLVTARLDARHLDLLQADADVAGIAPTTSVDFASIYDEDIDKDTDGDEGDLDVVAGTVGAYKLVNKGFTGSRCNVAVVDTGIAEVGPLVGRVTARVDLSFDMRSAEHAHKDRFGHGTHLAGIIAELAPGVGLVDVRVGDRNGAADVSQVIAAFDWIIQNKHVGGREICAVNLSFGTPATQSWTIDPLAYALEAAWRNGITVVVSAGNGGAGTTSLLNPSTHPRVIAVGASLTQGTATPGDDAVAAFSQSGSKERSVDVVAPGRSLASVVPAGSFVERSNPDAWDDERFRGSGTSQAAAVVTAGVALLRDATPAMTPDDVKFALMASARSLVDGTLRDGAGLVDLGAAAKAGRSGMVQRHAAAKGTGSLEKARGGRHVELVMDDGSVRKLQGEVDFTGSNWTGEAWAGSNWSGSNWSGSNWSGSNWSGSNWSGAHWNGSNWSGSNWSGSNWSGSNWSGSNWSGSNWSGATWNAASWG